MRKILFALLAVFLSIDVFAQLAVKDGSFREIPGFVNDNPDPDYQTDDNDKPYAVVIMHTVNITDEQMHSLRFEGNLATFIMLDYKQDDIWVYLTSKVADYVKISHPDLSSLEYNFPEDLKPNKGYEMTLVNSMAMAAGSGGLTVTTKPEVNATVSLNGFKMAQTTPYNNGMIAAGRYEVTLSKDGYNPVKRIVEVKAGETTAIEVEISVLYGKIQVTTEPVGATVSLDDEVIGTTPLAPTNIPIGTHTMKIEKPGYAYIIREINVSENDAVSFNEKLSDKRRVTISTDREGDKISVDGRYVGQSPLKTELTYGEHNIAAERHEGYDRIGYKTIVVKQEDDPLINLDFYDRIYFKVKGAEFEMIGVDGGTFWMGCTYEQTDCAHDELPIHEVTLSDYYIGKYEVTQALWKAVMSNNPSSFKGDNLPVEKVSWNDCQEFIAKLNQITGMQFCLPTEAQWEFAARGGNKSKGYKYSGGNNPDDVMWYRRNSGNKYLKYYQKSNGDRSGYKEPKNNDCRTHAVGTKAPTELGIYDMCGNVSEVCSDWYGDYDSQSQTDPTGPSEGTRHVSRGGNYSGNAYLSHITRRSGATAFDGLRLSIKK